MRIAYVVQDPGVRPGGSKGASVHVQVLCAAFRELGSTVDVVWDPDAEGVRAKLAGLHAEGALDLVYERYALGGTAAGEYARAAAIPHVLEVNAPLEDEAREHRPDTLGLLDERAQRRVFQDAALVVAVSSPVAAYARERGARAGAVIVAPNAVDSTRFVPRADDELRNRLVPRDAFVLGFHGRLRPWHGLEQLARATRELRASGRPAHLLCVGEGAFADALAGELEPEAWTHVPWIPHDEVAGHVACFDVLPLAYAAGAYFSPLKLTEAMAAGVVPVVPDVADLTELVEHGVSGLVYPPRDAAALSAHLHALAGDRELRARLGRAAREKVADRTWLAIAQRVLHLTLGATR